MIRILTPPTLAVFALLLAGCVTEPPVPTDPEAARRHAADRMAFAPVGADPGEMYGAKVDSGFLVEGVDPAGMDPDHVRQVVEFPTAEPPGTVVVDQPSRFLYFVLPEGKAIRYAVGVGPEALAFDGGDAVIDRKAAWPRWIPTAGMVERNPAHYGRFKDGVPGGLSNPMGARALYMQKDGRDTYYRVHGTNDPSSIGRAVSAGCIRMLNQDIIDLHARVQEGAKIVVR